MPRFLIAVTTQVTMMRLVDAEDISEAIDVNEPYIDADKDEDHDWLMTEIWAVPDVKTIDEAVKQVDFREADRTID